MDVIYQDVPILRQANIMDYSLLLAIEQNPLYRENHLSQYGSSQRNPSSNHQLSPVPQNPQPATAENLLPMGRINPREMYENQRHMFLSSDYKFVYHIAIIDYLQDYNYDKKLENLVKTLLKGQDAEISSIPPLKYSTRFMNFMSKEVILTEKKRK